MNTDTTDTLLTIQEAISSEGPLQQQQQPHHALPKRRTKIVFLYDSEEEDDNREKKSGEEASENSNEGLTKRTVAVEQVLTLNPPLEELFEMQQEAREAAAVAAAQQKRVEEKHANGMVPPMPLFIEDTTGVLAQLPTVPETRFRVEDVPPLRDAGGSYNGKRSGMPLRRHMSVEEAERLLLSRKRFREEENNNGSKEVSEDDLSVSPANGGSPGVDTGVCVPRPVVGDDGLVRALAVGGYQLTVDESCLQSFNEEEEHVELEGAEGEEIGPVTVTENAEDNYHRYLDDEKYGDFEDYDEEEEDDDDDEELDAALVVAIVEQLVRCCESDELDEALREDGALFLARARPFLEQVHAGEMEPHALGEELRSDILRLQRVFRRVNRPTDSPIVIDGVVMDM